MKWSDTSSLILNVDFQLDANSKEQLTIKGIVVDQVTFHLLAVGHFCDELLLIMENEIICQRRLMGIVVFSLV